MEKPEELRKQLRGPWRRLRGHERELMRYIRVYMQLLQELPVEWDPQQLYFTAKALALYRLMTQQEPEVKVVDDMVYIKGRGGDIFVLPRAIKYRGPFTRGYRYVRVNLRDLSYKIIKIRVRKVWKRKRN